MINEFKSPFLVGDILVGYLLELKHVYRICKVLQVTPKTVVVITLHDWVNFYIRGYNWLRRGITTRRTICDEGDVAFLVFDERQYTKINLEGDEKVIFSARALSPYAKDAAFQRNIGHIKRFLAYKHNKKVASAHLRKMLSQ